MMKLWQKIKFIKDGKVIKKYKFCGITLIRKEKCSFKIKWNILGIKICREKLNKQIELEHLFRLNHAEKTEKIDILIPIYNGYDYLQKLFSSIKNNTDLPYNLYVINDCSSDTRIIPFLEKQKKIFSNSIIVENNTANLGFLKSVNKLFDLCKGRHHIVIINTDVILPKNWASRLMAPMFNDKKVASVTPFSNAATIFSLPEICKDNDFSANLEKINTYIQKLNGKSKLLKFATGVGFCMAINKKALKMVGKFDEIFEQGYGEENDWCQRAIKKGFYNTLATNLFVWHKHGGSFESTQKKNL